MADKMMRIAGRSTDGLAKAISTDLKGRLSLSGSKVKIYESGIEYLDLDVARLVPGSSEKTKIIKENDRIRCVTSDFVGESYADVATTQKIDVTNLSKIVVDWAQLGQNSSGNQSWLSLIASRDGGTFGGVKYKNATHSFARRIDTLDISDVSGEYFIRLGTRGGLTDQAIQGDLAIYGVYLVESGIELQTADESLKKSVERLERPVNVRKINKLTPSQVVAAGEEYILVDNFEIPESCTGWSLSFIELNRHYTESADKMEIRVSYSERTDGFTATTAQEIIDSGLVYSEIIQLATIPDAGCGLVTPFAKTGNTTNVTLSDEYFTKPRAKYLQIKIKNASVSNYRILRPTLTLEGNF